MSKPLKSKKEKVPKLTEEQYAAYISTLKGMEESGKETQSSKENALAVDRSE